MKSRLRVTLLILLVVLGLVLVLYRTAAMLLERNFANQEQQAVRQNSSFLSLELDRNLRTMGLIAQDYAWWDDTYNFTQTKDPAYVNNNLNSSGLARLGVNIVAVLDSSAAVLFQQAYDPLAKNEIPFPSDLRAALTAADWQSAQDGRTGYVNLQSGIVMVVSRPILTNGGGGPPRGVLVFARYLTEQDVSDLANANGTQAVMLPLNGAPLSTGDQAALNALKADPTPVVSPLNPDLIFGYTLARDLSGQPAFLVRIELARTIYRAGQDSLSTLLLIMVVIGAFLAVLTAWLINRLVTVQVSQKASEARYRQLVEQVNAVIYIDAVDEDSSSLFISPQVEGLLGYPPEQWLKNPDFWVQHLHPEDRERVLAEHKRTNATHESFQLDYRLVASDGRAVWVRDESVILQDAETGQWVWQGVLTDISERKQAEMELQHRLALEQLVANISTQLLDASVPQLDEEIQATLARIGEFTGVDRVQLILVSSDWRVQHSYEWHLPWLESRAWQQTNTSLAPFVWVQSKLLNKETIYVPRLAVLPVEASVEHLQWQREGLKSVLSLPVVMQGSLAGYLSIQTERVEINWSEEDIRLLRLLSELFSSVLARKWAFEGMQASEARFRTIFEEGGVGIVLTDLGGRVVDANPAVADMLRRERIELLGSLVTESMFLPSLQEQPINFTSGDLEIRQREQQFVRTDGSPGWCLVTASPVHTIYGQQFVVLMIENITTLKLSEAELVQRQELIETVNFAAERFLRLENFYTAVTEALRALSKVLKTNRVILYENYDGPDGLYASPYCQSSSQNLEGPAAVADVAFNYKSPGFFRWAAELSQRRQITSTLSSAAPEEQAVLAAQSTSSLLALPVFCGERWWGVVRFDDFNRERLWSKLEIEALQTAVRILGTALQRRDIEEQISQLYQAEREQRGLAEALRRTAELLSRPIGLDEVLDAILTSLGEVLPHDAANILLLTGEQAELIRSHGYSEKDLGFISGQAAANLDNPLLQEMITTGQAVILSDVRLDERWKTEHEVHWVRSMAGAPIHESLGVVGFLILHSGMAGAFKPAMTRRLQAFADQAAIAIRNARLYDETRERARQMLLLNQITSISLEAHDPALILKVLARHMTTLFNATGTAIERWDEKLQMPVLASVSDSLAERFMNLQFTPGEETIVHYVIRTGRALALKDASVVEGISLRSIEAFQNESLLCMPLIADEKPLGAVILTFPPEHEFTRQEIELANQAAAQISLALAKASLLESEQKRGQILSHANQLLTGLGRVTSRTLRVTNVEQMMAAMNEELHQLQLSGMVALRSGDDGVLKVRYSFLPPVSSASRKRWDAFASEMPLTHASHGPFGVVMNERRGVFVDQLQQIMVDSMLAYNGRQIGSLLNLIGISPAARAVFMPLIIEDKAIGVLGIWGANLEALDLPVMEIFANQVAISIQNSNLYAEIKRLSITDDLTGMYNRRGMLEVGTREVERSLRLDRSLAAVMLDIDYFKRVNDTHGHPVGNEVLAQLGERFQEQLRGFDVLCRYGGEEFLVLAVECDLEAGREIAERLRSAMLPPFLTSVGSLNITISAGVAELRHPGETLSELIERADQALLNAKGAGRNQVQTVLDK